MSQAIANIGERRAINDQGAQPNLPPPEVAVSRPHPHRKDWALHAVGVAAILAICYFAEEALVVILASVLIAFILAPVADLFTLLRLPRSVAAAIAVMLLLAASAGVVYYGFNQAANLVEQL